MPRERRSKSIRLDFTQGPDGEWRQLASEPRIDTDPFLQQERYSPFQERSPKELALLRKQLNLRNPPFGVDIQPGLFQGYTLPPVPGSIGRWRGKGTRNDPHRWVGVSEKLAAYAALGLIAVWGLECIEIDVSNWWENSALNLSHDLSYFQQLDGLVAGGLDALGFHVTRDRGGNPTAVSPRTPQTFWSWVLTQAMIQGNDIETAASTVNGLSTGLPPGQAPGTNQLPPVTPPPGYLPTPPPSLVLTPSPEQVQQAQTELAQRQQAEEARKQTEQAAKKREAQQRLRQIAGPA